MCPMNSTRLIACGLKRLFDAICSLVTLIVLSPLLLVVSVVVLVRSGSPVLFMQERAGLHGRAFRIIKFRSMTRDAEERIQGRFIAADNPYVTPVGRFLRKTSLDELPQLWNVLKGEMSLVGPRPFPAYHNARFDPEFLQVRIQVRPGLTGLWQVSARSDGDLEVQQSLDSYYIRNWSLWLDIYILARTVRAVLAPRGSY